MAKIVKEGLTFDDVLLIPQKSEILPKEINTETYLTKNNKIKYTFNECWDGYSYRIKNGNIYG